MTDSKEISKLMSENKKRFLVINLGVIIMAFLAAIFMHGYIGSFSRYLADDYCTAGELKYLGFWPSQIFWYTHWTGRYSSTFTVTLLELFGSEIVPYLSSVYIVGFFLSGFFFIHSILKKISVDISYLISIFLTAITVFLTLYTTPNVGQNLYWLTGSSNYFVPIITFLILFGLLFQQSHRFASQAVSMKIFLGLFVAVLSWATSGFSEIVTVIQFLILLFVNLYQRFFHEEKGFKFLWVIAFWGCLLGLTMMIVSPGNAFRMRVHQVDRYNLFFLFTETLQYSLPFTILWFLKHVNLIWPIGTIIIMITFVVKKYFCPLMGNEMIKDKAKVLISVMIFVFLIFASFLPTTWATGNAPENRVLIYPTILLSILLVYVSVMTGVFLCHTISINNINEKVYTIIMIAFTVYFVLAVPIYEGRKVYFMKTEAEKLVEQWEQREIEIEEKIQEGQTQLTVKMIPTNIMGLEHLQSNPSNWINICAAKYYGIESILAE